MAEVKAQGRKWALWKVIIYLTTFFSLNFQVSWKGKSESGGYQDPWDRLLVAVLAVSMALILCL